MAGDTPQELTLGIITDLHFGPEARWQGKLRKLTHLAGELTADFVRRMNDELGGNAVCVATGGLATLIAPETRLFDHIDVDLTLHGLRIVWERNQP